MSILNTASGTEKIAERGPARKPAILIVVNVGSCEALKSNYWWLVD